ncbi:MAG TPA: transcriptional regulator NrdR [Anaerolineae bacterium]|nr:transcriptional regulator NrdR [Anaerolineae bacterium]
MKCPYCGESDTKVVDTMHESGGGIRRRRECNNCSRRFSTVERAILTTPLVVKSDGRREPFDREKLLGGIRVACAKRPISSDALEGLVNSIEARIQQIGKAEVPSKLIGDMVITGLKEMDQVAYIRFAMVYLGLKDVEAVRREIDKILER